MNPKSDMSNLDDELGNQLIDQGGDLAKKGITKVGNAIGKGAGKLGKKAGKAAVKTTAKTLVKLAKALVALAKATISFLISLGPIGLIILGGFLLITGVSVIAYNVEYETKGSEQQYSLEYPNMSQYDRDTYKDTYEEINPYNKAVLQYYKHFSERSYWKMLGNTLYSPDNYTEIKDFYEREKNFLLKPELLYSLDERVFDGNTRFPEQYVKPIIFSLEKLRSIPVVDQNNQLTAISDIIRKDGTETGKQKNSLNDYGLGTVFTYHKDKRTLYIEGDYYQEDYYDYGSGKIKQRKYPELVAFPDYELSGFPKDIYVIDNVMSMAGDIKYQYNISSQYYTSLISGETDYANQPYTKVLYKIERVPYKYIDENGEEKEGTRNYKLYKYRTAESCVYEEMPRVENTQTKETGLMYFLQYLQAFSSNLPNTATNFHYLSVVNYSSYMISGLSYGDLSPGSRVNTSPYNAALAYYDIMKKYAEIYAPPDQIEEFTALLVAIAAAESGGNHKQYVNADRCAVAGCGLMQVERPGIVNTYVVAYNYKTGQNETKYINSYQDVADVEDNIQVGAMKLAQGMSQYQDNMFAALQGYNFGGGAFGDALEMTATQQGITVSELLQRKDDISWMSSVALIHNEPLIYSESVRNSSPNWQGTYGDDQYLFKILSYYDKSIDSFNVSSTTSKTGTDNRPITTTQSNRNPKQEVDDSIQISGGGEAIVPSTEDEDTEDDTTVAETNLNRETMPECFSYKDEYVINNYKDIKYEFTDEFGKFPPVNVRDGIDSKGNPRRYLKIQTDYTSIPISYKDLKKMDKLGVGLFKGPVEKIRYLFKLEKPKLEYIEYVHHLSQTDRVEEILRIAQIMESKEYYSENIQTAIDYSNFWDKGYISSVGTQGMSQEQISNLIPNVDGYSPPFSDPNFMSKISSPYGMRNGTMHKGTDFAYPIGTPIYAVYEGVVTKAGPDSKGVDKGGGLMVFIEHPNGTETRYMHMSQFAVSAGDKVKAGQCIGFVGNTGQSTGPHLHFELLINGNHVEPTSLFKK